MKVFLKALSKTMHDVAIDIIVIITLMIFYSLVWDISKMVAVIMFIMFGVLVYMEYNEIKDDN